MQFNVCMVTGLQLSQDNRLVLLWLVEVIRCERGHVIGWGCPVWKRAHDWLWSPSVKEGRRAFRLEVCKYLKVQESVSWVWKLYTYHLECCIKTALHIGLLFYSCLNTCKNCLYSFSIYHIWCGLVPVLPCVHTGSDQKLEEGKSWKWEYIGWSSVT